MSKGKMTSVKVNEAKGIHEQMIDREWRRSISSGQDIERSEIAELMASDSDSTVIFPDSSFSWVWAC